MYCPIHTATHYLKELWGVPGHPVNMTEIRNTLIRHIKTTPAMTEGPWPGEPGRIERRG